MRRLYTHISTLLLAFVFINTTAQDKYRCYSFEFYDGTVNLSVSNNVLIPTNNIPSEKAAVEFHNRITKASWQSVIDSLLIYKHQHHLNDWLYYQLIRRTAQQIAPKKDNYFRYTLYKWFLLTHSGYDARLAIANQKVIFYVRNDEDISDIPFFMVDGQKYMCLNIHDYGKIDFQKEAAVPVKINIAEAKNAFSYKVTRMPDFKPENYSEKDIQFSYKQKMYHFRIKVNPEVQSIFANYPVVDFETYFNIPLSKETYSSLIPILKKELAGKKQKKGIDYLVNFTRYAFLYQDDEKVFGKEKRFSPEQTLFSQYSDCDDRVALFSYLVKEIYNLPMIALLYPTHITVAVAFDKPVGKPIAYNGKLYSVCEPTPQAQNLKIGQMAQRRQNSTYTVVYHYDPSGGSQILR